MTSLKIDLNIESATLFLAVIFLLCYAGVPETASAQTNAQRSFKVDVVGKGQPMILIPGLSSSGEVWDTTVARYRSNYECHVLTLAGFAGEPPIETPSLEKVRDELIAYIREKKLGKPIIAGHSLGGYMALWIAIKEPDLIGKLVIVDGLPFFPSASFPNATAETMKAQAGQMRKAMLVPQTTDQRRQMQLAILKTMIAAPEKIELAMKWGLASDNATIAQVMYEMFTTDLRPELARIKSQTLVVGTWIGFQQYATREQVEKVFRDQFAKLADYQFVMSEMGRHFVMFDDPDTLFKAMDDFLAGRKLENQNSDEVGLINLVKQMAEAQTNFDAATLEKIYGPEYVEVSPIGEIDSREKAIGFYKPEGDPIRDKVKVNVTADEFNVRLIKDLAIVIARFTFTQIGGESSPLLPARFRVMLVCRKEHAQWKVAAAQITGIRPPRPLAAK